MELGNYYMNTLIEYKTKPNVLDFQSYKYQIMSECIKELVNIEFITTEYLSSGYDASKLKNELDNFQKQITKKGE